VDIEQLMQNPAFLMGAQMMAANRGKGVAPGVAFGTAAMGTAEALAKTRMAAAKRSREEKALDLTAQRLSEEARHNKTAEGEASRHNLSSETADERKQRMYEQRPIDLGNGKFWTPGHGVQGGSIDPLTLMLMMNGGMGIPGAGGGGSAGGPAAGPADSDEAKRAQLRKMTWDSGPAGPPAATPATPAPAAAPAAMPGASAVPMPQGAMSPDGGQMPFSAVAPRITSMLNPLNRARPLTPQEKLLIERMQLTGGYPGM